MAEGDQSKIQAPLQEQALNSSLPTESAPADRSPESAGAGHQPQPSASTPPPASPEAASAGTQPPAGMVALPSAPPQEMSVKDMFMNADFVVQLVMLLLLLASIASWAVIIEKFTTLRNGSQGIRLFKKTAANDGEKIRKEDFPPVAQAMVQAGIRESGDSSGRETRSDYRERVERAMRSELSGLMDRLGRRTALLASVGSVSPFVGLFGTVWGIMHSFIGIAASGETTLAVVAPGIAEALFATAMGLVAAIPAVIAYNKITGTLKKITKEALTAIGYVGNRLARQHFSGLESEAPR